MKCNRLFPACRFGSSTTHQIPPATSGGPTMHPDIRGPHKQPSTWTPYVRVHRWTPACRWRNLVYRAASEAAGGQEYIAFQPGIACAVIFAPAPTFESTEPPPPRVSSFETLVAVEATVEKITAKEVTPSQRPSTTIPTHCYSIVGTCQPMCMFFLFVFRTTPGCSYWRYQKRARAASFPAPTFRCVWEGATDGQHRPWKDRSALDRQ